MNVLTLLRPALLTDCEDIFNAHQYAVRYTCARSYNTEILSAWLDLLSPESYAETLSNPDKTLWVIEFKNHIQGFFQLDFCQAQLDALYVHPFVHNLGLGTALLHCAEKQAQQAQLGMMKLYASLNSIPFYEINGFESLGECVLPLNKKVAVDCLLMRKYLW
ncbi:GNAT family N-acetyltransferase [Stenoxybacter acetivorans]|uniref:GNAT family N-acetyltransferase n=1 Tax=Stenoxybacter acetivorans TaxID=422441 RepID=UPI00055F478B|nr:GNAT family N-acetyltransferase [Stenoxybacter acetivorans]